MATSSGIHSAANILRGVTMRCVTRNRVVTWASASFALLLTAGAPAQTSPAAPTAAATQYEDALKLIEAWLDAQAAYDRVPALSAGAVLGQTMIWSKAWGALDHKRQVPARVDTIYGICSISKLFTSVAAMQLWEQGKLGLDEDIGKYLPTFAIQRNDPDSGPISVRELLMHSSGLPREALGGYWMPPDFKFPTREDMLKGLATQSTFMRAGDHYQYSNLGLALVGEVVAAVAGESYENYLQKNVLDPLRLADTKPSLPASMSGIRLAQGYGAIKRDGTRDPLPLYDTRGLTPAAGFSSTVEDLARFTMWQFRLRKNGGREVLKVATLREMHRIQWTDPDGKATWGLGFGITRDGPNTIAAHSGNCPGHMTSISLVLEPEVAVVAMINANDNNLASRYTRPMRQLLIKGLKLPVAPATGPALSSYAGRYSSQPWESESIIVPWGDGLAQLDLPAADPATVMSTLKHVAGDTFRVQRADGTSGAEFVFRRDAAGQVDGVNVWGQYSKRLTP
jgi:CubicO group peptidase (beta-lactamase class C family)